MHPDILRDALFAPSQTTPLSAITIIVQLLASGKIPDTIRPYLYGAWLTALLKKSGGVRPVACGDTFRRLASKTCLIMLKPEIGTLFYPTQSGVAVPSGAESVIHAWRHFFQVYSADPNRVAMKVDLDNAFNRVVIK